MSQNHSFFDDESSGDDFFEDFCIKINSKNNQNFHFQYNNETKTKEKEFLNENSFENEFNKVFTESKNYNIISHNEKELEPIIKRKIFKNIIPNKENYLTIKYNEKYFPFNQGIGLIKCLENLGYLVNYISPFEINLLPLEPDYKTINQTKFIIMDHSENMKGKIKKGKKKRKYKPDDIRKRIKTGIHKAIKNIININLKKAGSKKLFDFFPQYFISNITIKLNNFALNYTYEQLIKKDIAAEVLNQKKSETDKEKYKRNLDVLNYLDRNQTICTTSLFNKIRNMKYIDILKAYFLSKEFEESIIELFHKKERIEYIEEYINKSLNYVYFFSTSGLRKLNTNDNESSKDFKIEIGNDEKFSMNTDENNELFL